MAARAGQCDHRAEPDLGDGKKKLIILAAFLAGELEEYDCETCEEPLQSARGCKEDTDRPVLEFENGLDLLRCPVRSLSQDLLGVARAYRYREAGILPVAGGWLDQSGMLLYAFAILDVEIASYRKEK